MKSKFLRLGLSGVLGLAMLLITALPVWAASPMPQTSTLWRGEYYANPDLSGGSALVRSDRAIDFYWGASAPAASLPADGFSVRWTRTMTFEAALYRFWVLVDDGMRVFIDGAMVLDEWRDGGQRILSVDRRLTAGSHSLRVEYYDRVGTATARLRWDKVAATTPDDATWRGEYYANADLSGQPLLVRSDAAINFDWGSSAPATGLPADRFSVRWTRNLTFGQGTYRFRATADDGIRLYVDGVILIDDWRDSGRREMVADRALSAGRHTVRVEYYERTGMAVAQVWWDLATATVPDDPAWRGEYWTNMNLQGAPAMARADADLAFDWGQGSPGGTIPSDSWSARWARRVNFDAGTYRFHVLVDDGVRLWVGSRLILDEWSDHDSAKRTVDVVMAKGTQDVKVEYYERIGRARIQVWWEKVSAPSYPDWKGEYYVGRDLSGDMVLVRNDRAIDFRWGPNAPASGMPADDFSVRWTRRAHFEGGSYRFYVIADDGVRLWVDGNLIVDAWRDQVPSEVSADMGLARGTHSLRVEYFEHTGGARIQVWWKKVTDPTYPDWQGEYWSNRDLSGSPALVRNDKAIDFNWGEGPASTGLAKDNFSARWTRDFGFKRGVYRFSARADDGIRVYVDGQRIIDEWHSANNKTYTADISLEGTHRVVVEYYERGGSALAKLSWKRL